MANGTIAFDTLSTSGQISGTAKSLDTDYVVSGVPKVWINLNGTTFGIRESLGISSADDDAAGDYGINFSSNFDTNETYCVNQCASFDASGTGAYGRYLSAPQGNMLSSELEFVATYDYNQSQDCEWAMLQIVGDLA